MVEKNVHSKCGFDRNYLHIFLHFFFLFGPFSIVIENVVVIQTMTMARIKCEHKNVGIIGEEAEGFELGKNCNIRNVS